MKTSETTKELFKSLLEAKKSFQAIIKDASNPFHKSKYETINAVLEAIEPSLLERGLVISQGQEIEALEYNRMVIVTRLTHAESGEWLETKASCALSKNDAQGVGSAQTYMRRYALKSLFCLASEDDDGNEASGDAGGGKIPSKSERKPDPKKEEPYFSKICNFMKERGITQEEYTTITGYSTIKDLSPEDQFSAYQLLLKGKK